MGRLRFCGQPSVDLGKAAVCADYHHQHLGAWLRPALDRCLSHLPVPAFADGEAELCRKCVVISGHSQDSGGSLLPQLRRAGPAGCDSVPVLWRDHRLTHGSTIWASSPAVGSPSCAHTASTTECDGGVSAGGAAAATGATAAGVTATVMPHHHCIRAGHPARQHDGRRRERRFTATPVAADNVSTYLERT